MAMKAVFDSDILIDYLVGEEKADIELSRNHAVENVARASSAACLFQNFTLARSLLEHSWVSPSSHWTRWE
jgi:hypothetical protein